MKTGLVLVVDYVVVRLRLRLKHHFGARESCPSCAAPTSKHTTHCGKQQPKRYSPTGKAHHLQQEKSP